MQTANQIQGYKITKQTTDYVIYRSEIVKGQIIVYYQNNYLCFKGKYATHEFKKVATDISQFNSLINQCNENGRHEIANLYQKNIADTLYINRYTKEINFI